MSMRPGVPMHRGLLKGKEGQTLREYSNKEEERGETGMFCVTEATGVRRGEGAHCRDTRKRPRSPKGPPSEESHPVSRQKPERRLQNSGMARVERKRRWWVLSKERRHVDCVPALMSLLSAAPDS